MQQEITISILFEAFAHDPVLGLLEKRVLCPRCENSCHCVGCHMRDLIYHCQTCDLIVHDPLPFVPLFAADVVHAATMQHYEISCPYCQKRARVVGGSSQEGLFFVCEDRCHIEHVRTIRRY